MFGIGAQPAAWNGRAQAAPIAWSAFDVSPILRTSGPMAMSKVKLPYAEERQDWQRGSLAEALRVAYFRVLSLDVGGVGVPDPQDCQTRKGSASQLRRLLVSVQRSYIIPGTHGFLASLTE